MRSFSRQDLCTVRSFWPVMSMTSFSVCWASSILRCRPRQILNPSFQIQVAPAAASFFPNIVSGTSAQPVKRFLAFHSLCPCLTKQTLHVAASFQAILVRAASCVRARRELGRSLQMRMLSEQDARGAPCCSAIESRSACCSAVHTLMQLGSECGSALRRRLSSACLVQD